MDARNVKMFDKIFRLSYLFIMVIIICIASYFYCTYSFNDNYPNDYKQIESGAKI